MASVRVAIIGPVCSGKTTTLGHLRDRLAAEGLSVGGVLQPALRRPEGPADYVLEDAETGAQCAFVTRDPATAKPIFDTAGWTWAASRIRGARETRDVVVVDELGIVEARGEGHLPALVEPLAESGARVIFDTLQPAVTPGQAAVIYDPQNEWILGGGWIERAES